MIAQITIVTITIEMFDDRVEVSNPGGLLPIVAKNFGHKSMTRNPLIFGLRQIKNYATNDIVNDIVNENEQAIINLLRTKPGLNASEIAENISKSWRTTMRYLKSLNEKGVIEFRGAPKTGGYYLK